MTDVSERVSRPLLVTAIVAIAFFMEMLDSTIIVTALPKMGETLSVSPVALGLGLTVYMLTQAVLIPASGWIGERFGTRNIFCLAVVVFTLSSMACGAATDYWSFIAARAVQGFAGALMSPVGRLAVLKTTAKSDLVPVMTFLSFPGLIGPVLGPPLGGFLCTYLTWRWIFFVNLPVGVIGFILALRYIPNLRGVKMQKFDTFGFLANGLAFAGILWGMDILARSVREVRSAIVPIVLGCTVGWIALRHARRVEHPLVDISALRIKTFAVASLWGGSLFRFAISAPTFLLPLFFQLGLGMSAFKSGMLILVHALGDLLSKFVTTRTLRHFGFRNVLIATSVVFGLLVAAFAAITVDTPYVILFPILFVSGAARSFQMTAQISMQFGDVSPDAMAGASTFSSINQQIVRALGISAGAVILTGLAVLHGTDAPSALDYRISFLVIGVLPFLAIISFWSLHPDACAHVSGQRRRFPREENAAEAGGTP